MFGAAGKKGLRGEGIELKTLPEFIAEISQELETKHPMRQAIPENLPLLRAMQFVVHWGKEAPKTHTTGASPVARLVRTLPAT